MFIAVIESDLRNQSKLLLNCAFGLTLSIISWSNSPAQGIHRIESECTELEPGTYVIRNLDDLNHQRRAGNISYHCDDFVFREFNYDQFFLIGFKQHHGIARLEINRDTVIIYPDRIAVEFYEAADDLMLRKLSMGVTRWWAIPVMYDPLEVKFDLRRISENRIDG